jgi:diguanylate cyclase (GGDEF)-like protein
LLTSHSTFVGDAPIATEHDHHTTTTHGRNIVIGKRNSLALLIDTTSVEQAVIDTRRMVAKNHMKTIGIAVMSAVIAVSAALGLAVILGTNKTSEIAATATGALGFLIVFHFMLWSRLTQPMARATGVRTRESYERQERLEHESSRREFESRLGRALEMTEDEPEALTVIARALDEITPNHAAEVLLADSSRAHLHQALVAGPLPEGPCCPVESPRQCPAVRRGQSLIFADSEALDACPKLRDREAGQISAACIPISIGGRAIGVVHIVGQPGDPAVPARVEQLGTLAGQLGARVGMLRALQETELQAATDPLTGLLNRRSLENRVATLTSMGVSYTVAIGDLDNFKALNDTHGHQTGDRALRLFARTLRATARVDDLVARVGGEEFVVVFPNSAVQEAELVLQRVREQLMIEIGGGDVPPFTVSFGIAAPDADAELDDLISTADVALLAAKRAGRDRVLVFNQHAEGVERFGSVRPVDLGVVR